MPATAQRKNVKSSLNSNAKKTPHAKAKTYVDILEEDHEKVLKLFKRFEITESRAEKKKIVETVLKELKVHMQAEEDIIYPAFREVAEEDMMNEADEEHHVAKVLIEELEETGQDDDHFDAKFTVLGEIIEHHVEEEETEMFLNSKKTDVEEITPRFIDRKEQLMQQIATVFIGK